MLPSSQEEVSSQGKSKSSENCGENAVIESDTETNEPCGSGETHNAADGCDGRSGIAATNNNNNGKEENLVKMATKEDEEKTVRGEFSFYLKLRSNN